MHEHEQSHEDKTTFSGHELGQELEEQVEVGAITSDLLRDFYQTFRLSQVDVAIQPPLFKLLGKAHQRTTNPELLAAALQSGAEKAQRLVPPSRHVEVSKDDLNHPQFGFSTMWSEYANLLINPDATRTRSPEMLLDDMLAKDLTYQEKERPNRK